MCTLMRFLRFMGTSIYLLLGWMFEHECLDIAVWGVLYACVVYYFCICTSSA